MRVTSPQEVEAVLKLDGPARYRHFVKRVVDEAMAWGLWKEGWALVVDDGGAQGFPLWPAREYATAVCTGEWGSYEPTSIDLDDLLTELLPKLAAAGVRPAIFPTPAGSGVMAPVGELAAALRDELARYS